MPHKRNPITSERLTGMARLLRSYAMAGLENVALWHDRDISHSSVERVILPDAFHIAHYMTLKLTTLMDGLRVYEDAMKRNIDRAGGLLFSQSALGVLLAKGLDRHVAYRLVQKNAMRVWDQEETSLLSALEKDPDVKTALDGDLDSLREVFTLERYAKHIDVLFERAGLDAGAAS